MKSIKRNLYELCDREIHILELLSDGYENKAIAEKLYVSSHTVKAHISAILKKLKAKNRTHAVSKAIRKEIIQ